MASLRPERGTTAAAAAAVSLLPPHANKESTVKYGCSFLAVLQAELWPDMTPREALLVLLVLLLLAAAATFEGRIYV